MYTAYLSTRSVDVLNTLCTNLNIALYLCPYLVFYSGVNVIPGRRHLLSGGVAVNAQVFRTLTGADRLGGVAAQERAGRDAT